MTRWILAVGLAVAALGCGSEQGGGGDTGGGRDTGGGPASAFDPLYNGYFNRCAYCHAPNGPGRTSDIEKTLDFSTVETAYQTLTAGRASGLVGNQESCNGVAFVGPSYETSLVAAVLDEDVRSAFQAPGQPDCNVDAVSDMTVKVGSEPSGSFLQALRDWIESGTPR